MSDIIFKDIEEKTDLTIIEQIGLVYDLFRGCRLESSFLKNLNKDLIKLAAYFNTTPIQAFLLANIIPMNFYGRSVGSREMIDYFECNPMKMMKYAIELEVLLDLGLIKKQRAPRNRLSGSSADFTVAEHVLDAIRNVKSIEPKTINIKTDVYQILEEIARIWDDVDDNVLMVIEAKEQVENLIKSYPQIPLLKRLNIMDLNIQDAYLFLFLVWRKLMNEEYVNLDRATEGIFEKGANKIRYARTFFNGGNQLIEKDLVELVEADFTSNAEIKLTENANILLEECGLKMYSLKKKGKKGIIESDEIKAKQLIYNNDELQQLDMVKNVLDESNFVITQTRLADKGLPKGVTVLFHGFPGTGKTESVLQIAKQTGRQILKVDISQSKSAYFGESEKLVKKIFTAYKAFVREATICPILLINEADAILGKRKDIGHSNVAQTENSIQNILLEEIENFEGILMATTNLTNNLDPAFDRRFLFKVEFHKPNQLVKAQIWKMKLPKLSDKESQTLATQFDFSGGQIDNIVRKAEIQEIIHGKPAEFDQIQGFCRNEVLVNNRVKIGF